MSRRRHQREGRFFRLLTDQTRTEAQRKVLRRHRGDDNPVMPKRRHEGTTNREVAERLFVSPHTVNSHLSHVFAKLRINSRVELARLARDHQMA